MRTRHLVVPVVIALGTALASPPSARADDVNAAAKAFAEAQEVTLSGDIARAADLYELADELAPSAPALRNAARARLAAGHLAMAATNAAELLRRYPSDKESREVAEAILSKLSPQLAQLEVSCVGNCTLVVDNKALSRVARDQHSFFTQSGSREVVAVFADGGKTTQQVEAALGGITKLRFEPPPKPVAPPVAPVVAAPVQPIAPVHHAHASGLSRWWILGSGVLTAGLGAAAALSGMQTLDTRDKIRGLVDSGAKSEATDLYNQGRDQQIRTNILLGVAGAAGVATITLAFLTNWSGESAEHDVAVVPTAHGASLMYSARF